MKSSCRLPFSCASVLKFFVNGIQKDSDDDVRTYYVLAVSMNSIEFAFAMSMSQKETASLSIRLYSSSLSRHSSSRHEFSPLDLDDLHDKTVSNKSNARLIMIFGYVVWRTQKTDVHVESEVVFAKYYVITTTNRLVSIHIKSPFWDASRSCPKLHFSNSSFLRECGTVLHTAPKASLMVIL